MVRKLIIALITTIAIIVVVAPTNASAVWHGGKLGFGARPLNGGLLGGAFASNPLYAYDYYPGPLYGPPPGDAVAYCLQQFKSYDPGSGTYLGHDGQRHPCP